MQACLFKVLKNVFVMKAGINSSISLITKNDSVKFFCLGRNLYFSSLFIASVPLFVLMGVNLLPISENALQILDIPPTIL